MNPSTSHFKRTRIRKSTGKHRKKSRYDVRIPLDFDIDVPNAEGLTPLHRAVLNDNTVMLSQLLYYGADVNRVDNRNFTPFLLAIVLCNLQAVLLLFNYHDHFCPRLSYVHYMNILDLKSPNDELIIQNKKFLKFIFLLWEKLDRHLNDTDISCFWANYSRECNTPNHILRGNCFFMLEFALPLYFPQNRFKYSFSDLFKHCEQRLLFPKIRMELTWLWLSSSIEVRFADVKTAFQLYGHDREVDALISTTKSPLLMFILALDEDSNELMFKNYLSCGFESKTYNQHYMYKRTVELIDTLLNFFTLPWKMKKRLLRTCRRFESDNPQIMNKVMKLPEIPLLTELSRKQCIRYLKDNFEMTKVEEFTAIVRHLNLQEDVKNIILFRKPLYV